MNTSRHDFPSPGPPRRHLGPPANNRAPELAEERKKSSQPVGGVIVSQVVEGAEESEVMRREPSFVAEGVGA